MTIHLLLKLNDQILSGIVDLLEWPISDDRFHQ